ncbi:putative secreted protein (Por secretion system target) [Sediminitomix flava]|uniref:Putative secreted protein (Por secretion system target) n=2 Tax=Sediminitomix flava TaxID=379075 RepID=A0A315Z9M1_SEDFL|nr:putative secreted protein (Por secretion system target) [Sediminitomix flava]
MLSVMFFTQQTSYAQNVPTDDLLSVCEKIETDGIDGNNLNSNACSFSQNVGGNTITTDIDVDLELPNDFSCELEVCYTISAENAPSLSNMSFNFLDELGSSILGSNIQISQIQFSYDGDVYTSVTGQASETALSCDGGGGIKLGTENNGIVNLGICVDDLTDGFKIEGNDFADDGICAEDSDYDEEEECDFVDLEICVTLRRSLTATTPTDIQLEIIPKAGPSSSSAICKIIDAFPSESCDRITPVSLTSFSVKDLGTTTLLEWETASEIDSKVFEIQHSIDGINFEKIGEELAFGTTEVLQQYKFTHQEPLQGYNYYRLRQVDLDGSYEYSKTITLNKEAGAYELMLYPVPAADIVQFKNLRLQTLERVKVTVYDLLGMPVLETYILEKSNQLDVSKLPQGAYSVHLNYGNQTESFRLIKRN